MPKRPSASMRANELDVMPAPGRCAMLLIRIDYDARRRECQELMRVNASAGKSG